MNIEQIKKTNPECKFCLEEDKQNNLISPCKCDGSLKYVHLKCLEKYHEKRYLEKCEICNDDFNYQTKLNVEKFTSIYIIYLVCILNNFFTTLLIFDLDFSISLFFIGYSILYNYFFIKNKLFEINIYKNKRISQPNKYLTFYNNLNKILSNNFNLCFSYTLMYKILLLIEFINSENTKKIYKLIYFFIEISLVLNLFFYIKSNSLDKNIICKNNKFSRTDKDNIR